MDVSSAPQKRSCLVKSGGMFDVVCTRPSPYFCLKVVFAIALLGTRAPAQARDTDLDEVVVTAEVMKTDVPLSQTPQSVSVISRGQLDDLNVQSVQEALRYVPSVQSELAGRSGYEEIIIRGFFQSAYQYRDGLRLESSYDTQQEPFGLESIEVLQGPASVLYGQIAPGGLVNTVSKLPSAVPLFVKSQITAGSFGYISPAVDVGGAVDSDGHFSFRLPALYRTNNDPIDKVFAERTFVAPAFKWTPSDATSLTILSMYQTDRFLRGLSLPIDGTVYANPNGRLSSWTFLGEPTLGAYHQEQQSIGYLFEQRLSDEWTFRSKAREFVFHIHGPYTLNNGLEADQQTLDRSATDLAYFNKHVLSADNQFAGILRTGKFEHRILIGIDYLRDTAADAYYQFPLPSINIFQPTYGYTVDKGPLNTDPDSMVSQVHPYAQYRVKYDSHWIAVGGIGYGKTKTDTQSSPPDIENASKTIGNGALMYLMDDGFAPYLSYSQSFEPQFGQNPLLTGRLPPPDAGTQYEVGFKFEPPHRSFVTTFALFDIRLTNIVEALQRADGSYYSAVAGEQENRGMDVAVAGHALNYLKFSAGYTYLDAKIIRSELGLVGQRPLDVPRNAWSGLATLEGASWGWVGGNLEMGVRYQGERPGPNPSTDRLPGFTSVDLAAHYQWNRLTLAFNVKNLFNRRYFNAYFDGVNPGDPRTVLGTAQLAF